ncbi:MAG: DUF3830 family protein [Rhodopseudomonas palustris]|nr:MAG: DUF3830 family protein [Rhodopseudomonas palustris]
MRAAGAAQRTFPVRFRREGAPDSRRVQWQAHSLAVWRCDWEAVMHRRWLRRALRFQIPCIKHGTPRQEAVTIAGIFGDVGLFHRPPQHGRRADSAEQRH